MRLAAQARSRPGNAKDARCGITLFFSNPHMRQRSLTAAFAQDARFGGMVSRWGSEGSLSAPVEQAPEKSLRRSRFSVYVARADDETYRDTPALPIDHSTVLSCGIFANSSAMKSMNTIARLGTSRLAA